METILLVDDDPHVRPMIRDILELGGYQILDAGSGEEALRIEAAHAEPIHLLLTDIMMPGLTGPELARRFRPRRPQTRVLYMSAFSRADFVSQKIDLEPGVPVLVKPFSVDGLLRTVSETLAGAVVA
jgi:two-component system, cell cycle sensor histidine kinase and response regulator CckA